MAEFLSVYLYVCIGKKPREMIWLKIEFLPVLLWFKNVTFLELNTWKGKFLLLSNMEEIDFESALEAYLIVLDI